MFFPIAFFPSRKVFTSKEAAKTAFGVWNLFWSLRLALLAYTDSRAFGPQPSAFVIVLVLLYLAAAALQSLSFGATVFLPHLQVLPVDAMFSILSSLILVGSFMLRLIVHTALKDDVISECTTLLIGEKPVDPSVGIWGPRLSLVLPFSDATSWCADHHWTRVQAVVIQSLGVWRASCCCGIGSVAWAYPLKLYPIPTAIDYRPHIYFIARIFIGCTALLLSYCLRSLLFIGIYGTIFCLQDCNIHIASPPK
ncbi:hypothetical protein OF83DRAFT_47697 [Amylostereum chailletii]|nr:hypothetical protein OF83DRAFT_47697 [Amylostereum chailletii]